MEKLYWELKDVIKDEKEFNKLVKKVEISFKEIDKHFSKLSPNMSKGDFLNLLLFEDKLGEMNKRLGCYVFLVSSLNTKSQEVMKLQPKLEDLSIRLSDRLRPISFWIDGIEIKGKKRLDDKNAKRLFNSVPKTYLYSLIYSREKAKHNLKEEIEKIIHRKDINGINSLVELYDKITTNFNFDFEVKGKKKVYDNVEKLKEHIYSPKKEHRKAAYSGLFKTYKNNKETLFTIYSSIVKNWGMEGQLRKYKSPISVWNVKNSFSDEVVDTLLKVCKKNRIVFQDFFKLKAKLLGVKKLSRYDLYAPLKQNNKKYNFNEAKEKVMGVFKNFHIGFYDKANLLFEKNHVDSHPKLNKRTGAYCMDVNSKIAPYVLLNFVGAERDVSTLAHELGHAIHDLYTKDLPISVSHAPLPLCETASTFAENLLFEELLSESDKEGKKRLLSIKIMDSYATIMRQAYFVDFEKEAHDKIPKGLTENELSEIYLKKLKEQFGDSVTIPNNFKYEWSYIPHIFHTPFYCYAYSFGELLSLALYATYRKEGKKFIPKLERILSAGGSQDPSKLLKKEGFDISKEEFWQGGFQVIKEWVEELRNTAQ